MEKFDSKIIMHKNGRRVDWNNSFSPYDYKLSEVISAMGKEIRRGNEELSVFWAYQMMISGSESEEFLWERFKVISIEDIGLANPNALVVVSNAKELYYELPSKNFDRFATGAYTATYLARCKKTRYTHEMLQDIRNRLQDGEMKLEIPDYALDMHLPHARKMGRNLLHYLTEASKLENEDKSFSDRYKKSLIKREQKKK